MDHLCVLHDVSGDIYTMLPRRALEHHVVFGWVQMPVSYSRPTRITALLLIDCSRDKRMPEPGYCRTASQLGDTTAVQQRWLFICMTLQNHYV